MSNKNMIRAVPLPQNGYLGSMETTINGSEQTSMVGYKPYGKYVVKTSSYYSNDTLGFNAFNDDLSYWECDNMNNPNTKPGEKKYPKYTQKTYSGISPSSYLGGGNNKNTWITKVGSEEQKVDIRGEWIQIQLPYRLYVTKFSILTPTFSNDNNTYPMKFTVVSSNDGENWAYVEQQSINSIDLPSGNSPSRMFDVSSYNNYSYFRFIFTEMPPSMEKVRINTIQLHGTTELNKLESFATLNRSLDESCKRSNKAPTHSIISGADSYRPSYSEYGTVETSDEVEPNIQEPFSELEIKQNNLYNMNRIASDLLSYTGIATGLVIASIIVRTLIKK